MFDALSEKLQRAFSRLQSHGTVTEKDLDEALREVRVALLEADVNFRVVRELIGAVRERALGADVLRSLTGPQQVIAIVNQELVGILGENQTQGSSSCLRIPRQHIDKCEVVGGRRWLLVMNKLAEDISQAIHGRIGLPEKTTNDRASG